jgi:O-antigen/teichoic acid export membrane protein
MSSILEPTILPRFRYGLLANFAGSGWAAAMQLLCIPLYIKFMGIEAYGLIGFYLVFQAMTQLLDLGLSPTMNREMARYSVQPEKAAEARDLVRSLEIGYWMIGLLVATVLVVGSTWIATDWVKAETLPVGSVRKALLLMAMLSFFQWPVSFYQGGLMGLHRQVTFNIVRMSAVTLNTAGAILVLWLVSPTINTFLYWQIAVNAAQVAVLSVLLWKCLPASLRAPKFDLALIRSVGRFAAGVGGITLIGLALTQIDKIVVSKLLSLKIFGYYTLACAISNGLLIISAVIFNVIFPRMTAQAAVEDTGGVRLSYHGGSQLMAVLVLPLAAVLGFFSFDVLRLWTRNIEMASFDAPILSILVIGSALNALLYLPYALQLAHGWTRLNFMAGLISLLVVIPLIIPITQYFGPIGAATIWASLNLLNILIVVPIMHRRLLQRDMWAYYRDVCVPLTVVLGVTTIARLVFPNLGSPGTTMITLLGVWLCASGAAAFVAPQIRAWMIVQFTNFRLGRIKEVGTPG